MTDYFELGDVTIQRVVETEALFLPVREFFPAVTDEMLAEARPVDGAARARSRQPVAALLLPFLCAAHAAPHHPGR